MNHLSFTHYMILSSANAGINTVLMEEEESCFFSRIMEKQGVSQFFPMTFFMGRGWTCHPLSNGVKEVLLSHNKYLNIYVLPHPDREKEEQIWSLHLINLISWQILFPDLSCFWLWLVSYSAPCEVSAQLEMQRGTSQEQFRLAQPQYG